MSHCRNMNRRRKCTNHPDNFCYVCGKFTTISQRKNIASRVKVAYHLYFGCKVGDQDKEWAPHVCCTVCTSGLTQWLNNKRTSMPFAVPMIWREPTNHANDCYFCMTKISGHSAKTRRFIKYPDIPSALKPVPHGEGMPVPIPPPDLEKIQSSSDEESVSSSSSSCLLEPANLSKTPHLITQEELNDLVRDLSLSKQHAELLGSRLQEWRLLAVETRISVFRARHQKLSTFYDMKDSLCFCSNVNGLMEQLGCEYKPEDWRLFIDSSKASLKAVLLHNGNEKPSIPLVHAVGMKETYDTMQKLLKAMKYEEHNWSVCGDLKVIGLLTGLQSGYTKYCCFLCLWDSRADSKHYTQKKWPSRDTFVPGENNVQFNPLLKPSKVFLPPLHIKLGLMKNFVKGMNRDGDGFQYLKEKFPKISDAKIKAGIFIGPQIRELLRDEKFEDSLNFKELPAWHSFKMVVENFLGNKKAENYAELISDLLGKYRKMGCRMSLKMHFLHSHLNFFPDNLGAVSDEHGERFHQDISTMEQRYQGRWDTAMMGDYCWFLQRETTTKYKRLNKSRQHFGKHKRPKKSKQQIEKKS